MVFYIYKMRDINYIGSCIDIKNRTRNHKYNCYNENLKDYNYLIYQYIREKEIEIELKILFCYKKECSFKIQRLVEQYYINEYNSVNNGLNTINAFLNKKKYMKKYDKKYYENNKEKLKEKEKEYYEKNKNKIKKINKKYYEDNKEKINMKINCPICNSLIRKYDLKRHQKSKKCLKYNL